ncbi:LysR family transcriptional regulator [Jeongeupia chitinilytica]|uniref:Transcriptional regulator n=1 Tax=Jeongeupia chitinilytica TaxID=1041641 RepID=A0ABQ3GXD5_9NEIS|nr:LysR family transcriptional regulator [Jeongeupia chitinilytica]GHD58311.1 transcriptional regulator [Jeongeupia chitinilytica]
MHLDLVDLKLLLAIEELGSLSKAAATFPIAVSAASNRLRNFESRCALRLFVRSSEGMQATPAGQLVLDRARQVLIETAKLNDTLDDLAGQRRVSLRLAATTVANSTFLPAALGPFLADYPEVDLQLVERKSSEILQAVQDGESDLGVFDGNLPTNALMSLPFRQDRLVLLVSQAHPLADTGHVRLIDALDYPFVCLPPDRSMQRFIEEMAIRNAKPLRIRVRAPSFGTIAQLVAQQVGIAMLPEAAASRFVRELPTRIVSLGDTWASRELRICLRNRDELSVHAQQLLTYLMRPQPD